jgi:hypothetical protein
MPEATPDIPAVLWPLTPDASKTAARLAASLPVGMVCCASEELPAQQTLGAIESPLVVSAAFNEVHRASDVWGRDYRRDRMAWLTGAVLAGWESQEDAYRRFDSGISEALTSGNSCVVATHGMVLTTGCAVGASCHRMTPCRSGLGLDSRSCSKWIPPRGAWKPWIRGEKTLGPSTPACALATATGTLSLARPRLVVNQAVTARRGGSHQRPRMRWRRWSHERDQMKGAAELGCAGGVELLALRFRPSCRQGARSAPS